MSTEMVEALAYRTEIVRLHVARDRVRAEMAATRAELAALRAGIQATLSADALRIGYTPTVRLSTIRAAFRALLTPRPTDTEDPR